MKAFLITLASVGLLLLATAAHAQTAPAPTAAHRHAEDEGQPVYYNDGTAPAFGPGAVWPAAPTAARRRHRRAPQAPAETPHPAPNALVGGWPAEAYPQTTASSDARR